MIPTFFTVAGPRVNLDQLASRGPRSNPAVDRRTGAIGHGMGPQASNDHMSLMQATIGFEVWGTSQRIYIYMYITYKREYIYIYT